MNLPIALLTKELYADEMTWYEFFAANKTLNDIPYDESWAILFAGLKKNPKFAEINRQLRSLVAMNRNLKIYPHPDRVFRAFTATTADEIKVVMLGQDPYFNCEYSSNNRIIPQATGLSFSVANHMKLPSSLDNIMNNLVKFGHIRQKPQNGNLWFWAMQGCLMLNSALTVEDGQKKSHMIMWEWLTDIVIRYISDNMNGIIFVLWGGDAYSKIDRINLDRHHVIVSSHPSGLSVHKPFKSYPAFADCDHFGEINRLLREMNKDPILWD